MNTITQGDKIKSAIKLESSIAKHMYFANDIANAIIAYLNEEVATEFAQYHNVKKEELYAAVFLPGGYYCTFIVTDEPVEFDHLEITISHYGEVKRPPLTFNIPIPGKLKGESYERYNPEGEIVQWGELTFY